MYDLVEDGQYQGVPITPDNVDTRGRASSQPFWPDLLTIRRITTYLLGDPVQGIALVTPPTISHRVPDEYN